MKCVLGWLPMAVFLVSSLPTSAAAQSGRFDGCFDEVENLAMCNGILALAANVTGSVVAVKLLVDGHPPSTEAAVSLTGIGLYGLISGAVLLGSTLSLDSGSLRESGPILGAVNLGIGALLAVGGVVAAIWAGRAEELDDPPPAGPIFEVGFSGLQGRF
ncbi:MAG: hypothetical protein AAGF12_21065 [Myxococcota bacterium]